MLVRAAEESFDKGMKALIDGRAREALAFFEAAIALEKKFGRAKPQARYLSQYGLCLGTVTSNKREGIKFCREATTLEEYNPDLHWNLGRAYLAARRRREAHQALMRGLSLQPDHRGIASELRRMGVRRKPMLPFLSRDNPLNMFLGRLRTS